MGNVCLYERIFNIYSICMLFNNLKLKPASIEIFKIIKLWFNAKPLFRKILFKHI